MPGKAGTMKLVLLSGRTMRSLWTSATKPLKLMVRISPSARQPQMNTSAGSRTFWLEGCKMKGFVFVLFRICRHWRLLALLVWEWHLWAGYRGSLQNHRTTLPKPACLCEAETLQPIWPQIYQRERSHPCPPARYAQLFYPLPKLFWHMQRMHTDLLPESLNAPDTALLSCKLFILLSSFELFGHSPNMHACYFFVHFLLNNKNTWTIPVRISNL